MKPDLRSILASPAILAEPGSGMPELKGLQSAASRQLIQRIRDAIKRRDLMIPWTPSPGAVDANAIAEYLDGVLPPEESAKVEEKCLSADKYLAEVASCRQIVPSKHSVAPSAGSIARMYRLHKEPPTGVPLAESGAPAPNSRREIRWAVAVVGLILLCIAGIYGASKEGWFQLNPGQTSSSAQIASTEAGQTEAKASPPAVAAKPELLAPPVFAKYIILPGSNPSNLLRLSSDKKWRAVAPDAAISVDDRLLTLPGFRSEIHSSSGVRLRLLGKASLDPQGVIAKEGEIFESAVTIHSEPNFDLDLTLDRGRITIANEKPDGEAHVRLRFQSETWELTLAAPGSEAAIELGNYYPAGAPVSTKGETEEPISEVQIVALHGDVQLRIRYDSYSLHEPPGPAAFSWNNVGPPSRRPEELEQSPSWTGSLPLAGATEEAMRNLSSRLGGSEDASTVLRASLAKPDIASRMLAVYGLGAIDDLPGLSGVLGDERQLAPARAAAAIALRKWTGQQADRDVRLAKFLETRFSPTTAEIVLHLLHGFSAPQLQQSEVYAHLIGHLNYPDLPVRELAYGQLLVLIPEGRKIPYDAAGGRALREQAVDAWKKLVAERSVP
jgi:hypothetical protein